MFVSFDDGSQWQSLEQNLPMTSVRDIDVHGADLVIATHGRGFWIMDDVSALRQMGSMHDEVALFKPEAAIRLRPSGFTGTPSPKDEPLAANPPSGALIDYALPTTVAGPVTLTILDAQNRPVRRFSSTDKVPTPDPSKLEFASEWLPSPAIVSAAPGMHRFVWSLRYPNLTPASEPGLPKDGVWAPPGRYTVELNVGGRRYEQPLQVEPDPRVLVSTRSAAAGIRPRAADRPGGRAGCSRPRSGAQGPRSARAAARTVRCPAGRDRHTHGEGAGRCRACRRHRAHPMRPGSSLCALTACRRCRPIWKSSRKPSMVPTPIRGRTRRRRTRRSRACSPPRSPSGIIFWIKT